MHSVWFTLYYFPPKKDMPAPPNTPGFLLPRLPCISGSPCLSSGQAHVPPSCLYLITISIRQNWGLNPDSLPPKPPLLMYSAAAAAKLLQSCPTLCDPTDGSPPGSAVYQVKVDNITFCSVIMLRSSMNGCSKFEDQ